MTREHLSIKAVLIFFSCLFFALPVLPAGAQSEPWDEREDRINTQEGIDFDMKEAQREMGSSISGEVIAVNTKTQTIFIKDSSGSEGQYSSVQEYFLESDTGFTVVSSLSQINAGDSVTIDYYTFHNKRIADHILLEKRGPQKQNPPKPATDDPEVLVD